MNFEKLKITLFGIEMSKTKTDNNELSIDGTVDMLSLTFQAKY